MSIIVKSKSLTQARIIKGYSQRDLAKIAGLSSSLISLIENNERNPSPSTAKKICKALNADFDDIFFTQSVSN